MATFQTSFVIQPFTWTPRVNGAILSFEAETIEDAAKQAKHWLLTSPDAGRNRDEATLIHLTCFDLMLGGSFVVDTLEPYVPHAKAPQG